MKLYLTVHPHDYTSADAALHWTKEEAESYKNELAENDYDDAAYITIEEVDVPTPDLDKVKSILEKAFNAKGHDRCWYHPQLLIDIAVVLGINHLPNPKDDLPPECEFARECEIYRKNLYNSKDSLDLCWRE